MAYVIDRQRCINCGWCRDQCPTRAVAGRVSGVPHYEIELDWCIDCDLCAQICPVDCIAHRPELQPSAEQAERAAERARAFSPPGNGSFAGRRRPPWMRPHREGRDGGT